MVNNRKKMLVILLIIGFLILGGIGAVILYRIQNPIQTPSKASTNSLTIIICSNDQLDPTIPTNFECNPNYMGIQGIKDAITFARNQVPVLDELILDIKQGTYNIVGNSLVEDDTSLGKLNIRFQGANKDTTIFLGNKDALENTCSLTDSSGNDSCVLLSSNKNTAFTFSNITFDSVSIKALGDSQLYVSDSLVKNIVNRWSIYQVDSPTVFSEIRNTTFRDVIYGILIYSGTSKIYDSTFENIAYSAVIGNIDSTLIELNTSTIKNVSRGMDVFAGNAKINRSIFNNNTEASVSIGNSSSVEILNSVISNSLLGINIIGNSSLNLNHSILYKNNTGIKLEGSGKIVDAKGNIIAKGSNLVSVSGVSCASSTTIESFTYNDVWNNATGNYDNACNITNGTNGNISLDPLFVAPDTGNFTLGPTSPVIGAVIETNGTHTNMGPIDEGTLTSSSSSNVTSQDVISSISSSNGTSQDVVTSASSSSNPLNKYNLYVTSTTNQIIDIQDFAIFVTQYKKKGVCGNVADFDGDCDVDISDFALFRVHYQERF